MAPREIPKEFCLESVRDSLIRQEDSIVFALIERARFPHNRKAYEPSEQRGGLSLSELFVKEAEALQAKVFHPASASVCVNKDIWDMYVDKFLPMLTCEGDDGNYAATVACDLVCLQALSRRIHYGKHVAEVKFREAPQDYSPLIRATDRDALMRLLTFEKVEEMVKKRVAKKARVFGQSITLEDNADNAAIDADEGKCKVDPTIVSRLYADWVMPLTKLVEVEYLLRSLD